MKVMIADDSALVQERLAEMLSEIDDVELVGQANSVKETLDVIHQNRPDVVILDLRMPGGSGLDVLETLKQEKQVPLVIVLTAFPNPQYQEKCEAAGAAYFFDKTSEFDRIPDVLNTLKKRHQIGS